MRTRLFQQSAPAAMQQEFSTILVQENTRRYAGQLSSVEASAGQSAGGRFPAAGDPCKHTSVRQPGLDQTLDHLTRKGLPIQEAIQAVID